MNILFTGVGRRIELIQAFREAALVLNKPLLIFGADMAGTAPALSYCDFTRKVVSMQDDNYINNLLRICEEDKIDLVIPTIDTDLLILAENKNRFKEIGTFVMVSDPEKVRICRDKNYTSQFFQDCGLCAPHPISEWTKYKEGYPAFIKPKDGSSSINAYKVEDETELEVYAQRIKDYIVQPFVNGREYTIDVFCDWHGIPISIVPRERLQIRAGEVLKTKIFLDPKMIKETKILCSSFKPCGPITIQLIRDNEGVDWFIEINPRFGGGAPLSMKAGARSAEYILKLMDDEEVDCCERIADGAIYSRFDQSVCINEGCNTIKGVIFDLDDTLFSEKEYVKSGFKVVSEYLGGGYEDRLWRHFQAGRPAIDSLLIEIGRQEERDVVLELYRMHKPDIHLYPGALKLIKNLEALGCKVGFITDGRPEGQRNKFEALGLTMKDAIITDELGGVQFRKPCEIAFRILQTRWRLNPSEIVYIGDNLMKDIQAPQQLGMKFILYDNCDGLYYGNKDDARTIQSIKELSLKALISVLGTNAFRYM